MFDKITALFSAISIAVSFLFSLVFCSGEPITANDPRKGNSAVGNHDTRPEEYEGDNRYRCTFYKV